MQTGGNPLKLPTSIAEADALSVDVTGGGQITTAPFCPNVDIALGTFQNVPVSEDDVLQGISSDDTLDGGAGNDTQIAVTVHDLITRGDNAGDQTEYDYITQSTGDDTIDFSDIVTGDVESNYRYLDSPINARIDGTTNTASVDKGPNGADTIVEMNIALNS